MNQRTPKQSNSIHLYCELVAEGLNNAGLEMKATLPMIRNADVPWTKETVKSLLWKPLQEAMLQKDSTKKLTKKEVGQVYEVLNRHLGEKLGLFVDFPHIERLN